MGVAGGGNQELVHLDAVDLTKVDEENRTCSCVDIRTGPHEVRVQQAGGLDALAPATFWDLWSHARAGRRARPASQRGHGDVLSSSAMSPSPREDDQGASGMVVHDAGFTTLLPPILARISVLTSKGSCMIKQQPL